MFETYDKEPTLLDVRHAIEDTMQNFGTVFLARSPELIDVVTVPVEGPATLYRTEYPYYGNVTEHSGLRVAGILRRNNLLRKYVKPCEVEEVEVFNRLVLEAEDGSRFTTPRIAEIKPGA